MRRITTALSLAATAAAVVFTGAPVAAAKNGDTHVVGVSGEQIVDCNNATLFVNGSGNLVTALGSCWAISMQGSNNTVIADNVVNDITVYGSGQTAFFKTGDPVLIDRGRELGMTNRIDRIGS